MNWCERTYLKAATTWNPTLWGCAVIKSTINNSHEFLFIALHITFMEDLKKRKIELVWRRSAEMGKTLSDWSSAILYIEAPHFFAKIGLTDFFLFLSVLYFFLIYSHFPRTSLVLNFLKPCSRHFRSVKARDRFFPISLLFPLLFSWCFYSENVCRSKSVVSIVLRAGEM